ncbi:unnamed protein product [Urochloa decumbens]|uniref:F-box domain-containing protein n=1 Tax=Urochloa decumbens TaxID=240449 RepID=A0ABC8YLN6_9POAL
MEGDPTGLALTGDALSEVLRCLPPRSLAASRCVCKAWRAIVDALRLLLPELLPQSVRGIFAMCHELDYPDFLAHPSMDPDIFGKLDFHPNPERRSNASVLSHCNGLLLYKDMRGLHVANPATQRRALLPPLPPRFQRFLRCAAHLVFDPAESLHFEVFLVPEALLIEEIDMEERQQERDEEWPALTCVLCVFSSHTSQWEERSFVREGEAAGMVSDEVMRRGDPLWSSCSAYWHGVLFVQCLGGFTVMRINLSYNKSKEGLCCASFHDWYKLRVWVLEDSFGMTKWRLKHHIDILRIVKCVARHCEENEGPWNLQDANSCEHYGQQNLLDIDSAEDDSNNALVKSKVEWDSDNDNIVDNQSEVGQCLQGHYTVLGFHPYKDIIFLNLSLDRAVAYHLSTSIVQDLGKICPDDYCSHVASITSSFPYTPCFMPEFPTTN